MNQMKRGFAVSAENGTRVEIVHTGLFILFFYLFCIFQLCIFVSVLMVLDVYIFMKISLP